MYIVFPNQKKSMAEKKKYPSINVINAMRGFPASGLAFKITPYRLQMPDGKVHVIKNVRRMTTQKVGGYTHFHYVVQSREERYFHIVLDSSDLTWKLVQEIDEQLFFNG